MATHLFDHRTTASPNRAAWLTSAAVHASLLAALAYVSWTTLGGRSFHRSVSEPGVDEAAVVVGLGNETVSDPTAESGIGDVSDVRLPSVDMRDNLAANASLQPLAALQDSPHPVASPPRLPLLALGGLPRPSASAAATRGAGPIRVNDLADRATVTVFGAVGEGRRFVYLFDHSTSMTGPPLAAAKQQLLASLDALTSVHQFQVIFFNHEVHAWDLTGGQQRIPYASERNKKLASQFVRTVVATGATDRLTPLRRALAMEPDVVFFLTDADDVMPDYDVRDVIERAQRVGASIACIEFGETPPSESDNFLKTIARGTGGDYVYVDTTQLSRPHPTPSN